MSFERRLRAAQPTPRLRPPTETLDELVTEGVRVGRMVGEALAAVPLMSEWLVARVIDTLAGEYGHSHAGGLQAAEWREVRDSFGMAARAAYEGAK